MMVFVNEATASATLPVEAVKSFLRLLAPFAPHLAEELWHRLGEESLVAEAPWPVYDERLAADDEVTVVVQLNGKKRAELSGAGRHRPRVVGVDGARFAQGRGAHRRGGGPAGGGRPRAVGQRGGLTGTSAAAIFELVHAAFYPHDTIPQSEIRVPHERLGLAELFLDLFTEAIELLVSW